MSVEIESFATRRTVLGALATSPLWMGSAWAQPNNLKISHQFPGGSIARGDFRDRLCRMFASEVEKRTRGGVKFSIYPDSTMMQPGAQFGALRSGQLDMALVPLSYAGAEAPEANIGLSRRTNRATAGAMHRSGVNCRGSLANRAWSSSAGSGRPVASRRAATRSSPRKTRVA